MRNVVTSSAETSFGRSFSVKFTLCGHCFEWTIDHHVGHVGGTSSTGITSSESFDVMPIWTTFDEIDYDPYKSCADVLNLMSPSSQLNEGSPATLSYNSFDEIVKVLTDSIVVDQKEKVKLLAKSSRSSIILDMVDNFPSQDEVFYLIRKLPALDTEGPDGGSSCFDSIPHLSVEFPLLQKNRLCVPELEYLIQFISETCPTPIYVLLTSTDISLSNSFNSKPGLQFPKENLPNLRNIALPNWDSSSTLYDYLPAVEQRIADTWGLRKKFVSELQQLAAVVEFDPVDFSFVSIAMRLTRHKHFILSIVDLRISGNFPTSPILLMVHDLLSGTSYPLESKRTISSTSFFSSSWTAERMAREYFLALCEEVETMAFGAEDNKKNAY